MSIKSKDRAWIIEIGVRFENVVSFIIANKLNINREESVSFGDGSQALGFNQRMNLLLDMNLLSSENNELAKFQKFMFMRNKFAHVWQMDSLQKIFKKYPDLIKFIEKNYREDIAEFNDEYHRLNKGLNPEYRLKINEPERYYQGCFDIFYDDLFKITQRMQSEIIEELRLD